MTVIIIVSVTRIITQTTQTVDDEKKKKCVFETNNCRNAWNIATVWGCTQKHTHTNIHIQCTYTLINYGKRSDGRIICKRLTRMKYPLILIRRITCFVCPHPVFACLDILGLHAHTLPPGLDTGWLNSAYQLQNFISTKKNYRFFRIQKKVLNRI